VLNSKILGIIKASLIIFQRRITMKKTVGILMYAMEREKQGAEFFKAEANKMTLESAKGLFLQLAEIEMDHYNYLKEQLDHYTSKKELKDVDLDLDRERNIFKERAVSEEMEKTVVESMVPYLSVLRTAYLMEKDFAEFYLDAANNTDNPKAKNLFKTLASWEQEHESIFKQEHERLMEEYMNQPWGG
jgi:rubrerythrin